MNEKEKELLHALNIIKKTCEEHDCSNCPCACLEDCMIHQHFPDEWDLVVEQPIWRAFNY